jgi:two-component system phosphate regulon sensor histidine kinase PhoR
MKQLKFTVNKRTGRLILTIAVVTSMIGLLVIQINWLMESIKMQEAIFTKGVNMALQQTALNMANDEELNLAMQNSIDKDSLINSQEVFTQNIISRLDSTVQKELEYYHINLDFHFILINGEDTLGLEPNSKVKNGELFHQSFKSPFPDAGIDLAVHFPGRSTFILKRVGIMFATSVVLILFTIVSIFLILSFYSKERLFAQQIKDMIGNLTHEFMTPISSISLAGNMILNRSQKLGEQSISQFATAIKDENKKLQRQVNRLLQLAAVEESGFDFKKEKVDIHLLIEDAIQSMSFQIKQNDAQVECDFKAGHSFVFADAMHFTDVFINFLSNSIKYAVEKPHIRIETANSGQNVEVMISDNGIGIPAREHKKIFEKYYRVPTGNLQNTRGFGIGLYYVKTVVQAHSGTISVKSENGKGSTFVLSIPILS